MGLHKTTQNNQRQVGSADARPVRLSALVAVKRPSMGSQFSISESIRPPKGKKYISPRIIYFVVHRRTHYAERRERKQMIEMHVTPDKRNGCIAGSALHVGRRLLVRRGHRLHPTSHAARRAPSG